MISLEKNKWQLKNKIMTYILGGTFQGKPFILVDKVVNFDPINTDEKLYQSKSNNSIYISLTGDGSLMNYIKKYDREFQNEEKKLQINDEFIRKIATDFSNEFQNIESKTILYVIDGSVFYRICIEFNNGKYVKHTKQPSKDGEFYMLFSDTIEEIPDTVKDIQDFGMFWVKKIYDLYNNELSFDEYFKSGFSFKG